MKAWENAFFNYFAASAAKPKKARIGLEIEHFVVDKNTKEAVSYCGTHGVRDIVAALLRCYPDARPIRGEDLLGFDAGEFTITLEPAAQLEISTAPKVSVKEIDFIYRDFVRNLTPILQEWGCEMVCTAFQPVSNVEDLQLIPKERYRLMDGHFQKTGSGGREMMRGTASMQISVDYCSEEDFRRKIQAAYYFSPLLKLLCDTSSLRPGGDSGQRRFLKRTDVWNRVDPRRCGILPDIFAKDYGFLHYIRFLGDMPPIFIMRGAGQEATGHKTVRELYGDTYLTEAEIEHVLSMAFPDVRLKKYLEIRVADSAPPRYVPAYCALIKGLFYNESALDYAAGEIAASRLTEKDITAAEDSLTAKGWEGSCYGRSVRTAAAELLALARKPLNGEERAYLEAFESVIEFQGIANVKN